MKKQFLFLFLISGLILFSSCSLFKKDVKVNDSKITERTSCDLLCLETSNNCLEVSYNLCSKLCPNWNDEQKKCVQASKSCDELYDKCQIENGFVFEPKLENPCSLACNNYVKKCDIQASRSQDVNNQNIFDECLLQCDLWTSKQIECVKNANLCTDIMMECGS